jgi:hypothetical protein
MSASLNLDNITLVTIGSKNISETKKALNICNKQANFHSTFFFTEKQNHCTNDSIRYISIDPITNWREYQSFRIIDFPNIFLSLLETDFFLIVEWDGFVVNPDAWSNVFYDYDYIGAPLPNCWKNICGNGGFTLRSKKFLTTQKEIGKLFSRNRWCPEDIYLSFVKRKTFESAGCKYAPTDIAYKFATENGEYKKYQSFGFHSFILQPQFRNYF